MNELSGGGSSIDDEPTPELPVNFDEVLKNVVVLTSINRESDGRKDGFMSRNSLSSFEGDWQSVQVWKVKDKKVKVKSSSEISSNKSNLFSDEDSEVEDLAKFYEEKYGTCNDYAELGEGYDEEDSFIDNSDAVNDLVPSGIQTEFGGFYINRGKLNFVKEDNSSSSTSEDADKFLAQNRLNSRRIISDDESEEKETSKNQSNILQSSTNNSNIHSSSNNNINSSSTININNSNNNANNHNNNHNSNNMGSNIHNNIIKNKKRSKEYQHKSKKIRKTATPKIPDHLLYKKPFPGSLEYRKNINEFKKNRLKTVETDKKCTASNSVVNSANTNNDRDNNSHNNNINAVNSSSCFNNHNNNNSTSNNNNNNNNNINNNTKSNNSEEDVDSDKKESGFAKKKPLTVKELLKERDGSHEEGKLPAIGQRESSEKRPSSSSSESCESSSSDSESYSSEDTPTEKEKISQKPVEEIPPKSTTINGSISKDITAKSFAHLSDSLKELIAKVLEISKEEKNKFFNSKLNSLLLSLDDKLRELPMAERNGVLEHVAEILQMKKDNITKRTKKLLVLQEEGKMTAPLRKLKEAVANIMPLLESNYFNEYTKAAGTSPQIYAELSRYYWSIDPSSLPQRKFPWNEELRRYLREIVQYRKNCYYIIKPRKESLVDYIRSFMEAKVKNFWPEKWMTVEILLEEAQVTTQKQSNDKQKSITKILGTQNSSNVSQKKTSPNTPSSNVSNRKQGMTVPTSSTAPSQAPSRKPSQTGIKNPEVKSILIPRKTPQGGSSGATPPKSSFSGSPVNPLQNINQGSRLQVTLNRMNVQEYLDRVSGSQTSISRNSQQQISPNRSQQSVSPNRLVKTSPPNSVLNSGGFRPSPAQKNISPGGSNKSISSSVRNCNNQQSVLKTVGSHGNPAPSVKTSPNSVTISPVNESIFKDLAPSPEVLNLTKNSSVFISKVKDGGESRTGRSSSPSIGIPLPSGITISPTSATPSTFLTKPQKQIEKNADVKINVSITKQESGVNLAKEKRDAMMNLNVKREGPLQNIPDCISVTSKVVANERPKYEHVRKRALHEYHQQQHSPEKMKFEEKKLKTDENLLTDLKMDEDKMDDKNFSKIFDSVIAKTSETVRQSESAASQVKLAERFNANPNLDSGTSSSNTVGGSGLVKNCTVGGNQFKNYPTKLRDVRTPKEKPFYPAGGGLEEKNFLDADDRNKHIKEQRVQMEMDRVMQNLVELSREKNPDYDMGYPSSPTGSSGLKPTSFQEPYQKILFK